MIVGQEHCRHGILDIELYSYDSSPFFFKPDAIVFPGTTEELAKVVRLAHDKNVPLVARGAGTSLSGGAVAAKGGIMLVTTRLNRVLELNPLEETVLVESGVVNLNLQNYLAEHGFMFPPDPASQKSATLGGNIAENAGGPKGVKYGITKHYVHGLEVVLADGSLTRTGALADVADQAGPDLTGLFLASEGAFGLVTKALLKITPLPQNYRTVLAIFDDLGKSGKAVSEIIAAGIIPTAMEIMDHELIVALEDYLHLGFPLDAQAMLLIEVDGLGPELDGQMERIVSICREVGATSIGAANTAEERDKLWLARRSGNGAMGRIKPALIVQDVTVPVNRLPEMLSLVQEVAKKHNVIIVQMAHAGDGNLHPHILYTPGDDEEYARALEASHDIFTAALAAGGSLTGEHGIGLEKISFMDKQFNRDELNFMAAMKRTLDPQGRLNPGKVLPQEYLPL
ncbi:glycolate oxidase subunit GlcD [Deltaproteobacteria bacterium Smac51]|nr:glycolate oxidase subunit GlcD [Deltaproteobacteria bacterium Smac51]